MSPADYNRMPEPTEIARHGPEGRVAVFSGDLVHRYLLTIPIVPATAPAPLAGGSCVILGLNPSTADEMKNDPTVTRDCGYLRAWRYGTLVKANLFGYRATDPAALYDAAEHGQDIIGPENDRHLCTVCTAADLVVCAWGNHGILGGRGARVRAMLIAAGVRLSYLRMTKRGQPGHELYLPATLTPRNWT